MGVTKEKYSRNTYEDRESGQVYALLPLALAEYISDANFMQSFFCNNVWNTTDSEGRECVIGLIDTRPGANNSHFARLHADMRRGKLYMVKNQIRYNVLNDGGLNTKAFAEAVSIDLCAVNLLAFTIDYRNAYYLDTDHAEVLLSVPGATRTVALADLPLEKKADGTLTFLLTDDILALNPQEGNILTLKVQTTNGEGVYESNTLSATVGERVELVTVYKIDSQDQDPRTGEAYRVLFRPEFWVAGDRESGYTLQNLFDDLGTGTVSAERDTISFIHGLKGNGASASLLTTGLPAGLYYGFPASTPFVDADPPANDKIVWVKSSGGEQGMAYKVGVSTYEPVEPVVKTEFTGFTAQIVMSGTPVSYATDPTSSGIYYNVHIVPSFTATASKAGVGMLTASLYLVTDGSQEVLIWKKNVDVSFSAAGTETVPYADMSETGGEEGVPTNKVGYIDTVLTSQPGMHTYEYILRVEDSDPQTDDPEDYPFESTAVSLEELLTT